MRYASGRGGGSNEADTGTRVAGLQHVAWKRCGQGVGKVWARCGFTEGPDHYALLHLLYSIPASPLPQVRRGLITLSCLPHPTPCRRSGIFGSGLITLSRWPILETAFHQYSAPGDALALTCGDYLAAKGVGKCEYAFQQYSAPGDALALSDLRGLPGRERCGGSVNKSPSSLISLRGCAGAHL